MTLPKTKIEAIELLQSGKELTLEQRDAIASLFRNTVNEIPDWVESTENDWYDSGCEWEESSC